MLFATVHRDCLRRQFRKPNMNTESWTCDMTSVPMFLIIPQVFEQRQWEAHCAGKKSLWWTLLIKEYRHRQTLSPPPPHPPRRSRPYGLGSFQSGTGLNLLALYKWAVAFSTECWCNTGESTALVGSALFPSTEQIWLVGFSSCYFGFNLHFRQKWRWRLDRLGCGIVCLCSCWKILADVKYTDSRPVHMYMNCLLKQTIQEALHCSTFNATGQPQLRLMLFVLTFTLFANQA